MPFRTRLTRYIHDLYLNDSLNYYKLSNLDGGVGQGADQFITQDLTLFCGRRRQPVLVAGEALCGPVRFQLPAVPVPSGLWRCLACLAITS